MAKTLVTRSALIAVACSMSIATFAVAGTPNEFNVPAGELATALKSLADQGDVELVYQPEQLRDLRTEGVHGVYSAQEAIAVLLKGTQLQLRTDTSGAMVIALPEKNADGSLRITQADTVSSPAAGEGAPKGADEEKSRIQEIVVTAQKREERLVDVPLSITVVGGEALDESNVSVGEQLNRIPGVTNVVVGATARAGLSVGSIIIRGAAPIIGGPTSAYYLDSLPLSGAIDASAYDLSRIEVLRGPQGTLYGANAFNGAVRILTQAPNLDDFEFKARTSVASTEDGGESYRGDAAMNVPIIDGKLAVRGVIGRQYQGGWLDQLSDDDTNSTEIDNYRFRIRAQPTERLTVDGLTWIYRGQQNAPTNSVDGRTNPSVVDEFATNEFDLFGLTVGYGFDGARFTSATSHMETRNYGRFDYLPWTLLPIYNNFKFDTEVFSQEFGLASTGEGDWRWSLGAIYIQSEGSDYLLRTSSTTGANAPGFFGPNMNAGSSDSYAVFGEATRLFFDGHMELTGGLRYFHDEVENRAVNSAFFAGGVPPEGLYRAANEFEHVSPRFVIAWHPNEDATLYASYGQGFRSGLNQSGQANDLGYPPADPDTLTNYEIGYKASSWGGRLNVETAVFYIDWQDVQQFNTVQLRPPEPANPNGFFGAAALNTGSATGPGIEGAISAEVLDSLVLSGSFSWNGLEVDQDVFDGSTRIYRKGERIAGSAEYTLAAGLDYSFPLTSSGLGGRFSAGASYIPEYLIAVPNFTTPANSYQEAVLNLRASFAIEGDHWTASLFGENLADESGLSQDGFRGRTRPPPSTLATPPAGVWNTWMRPRSIGVQFEYRYGK